MVRVTQSPLITGLCGFQRGPDLVFCALYARRSSYDCSRGRRTGGRRARALNAFHARVEGSCLDVIVCRVREVYCTFLMSHKGLQRGAAISCSISHHKFNSNELDLLHCFSGIKLSGMEPTLGVVYFFSRSFGLESSFLLCHNHDLLFRILINCKV